MKEKVNGVRRLAVGIKYLIMLFFLLIFFYPFIWILFSSVRDNYDILTNPFAFPKALNFENYKYVIGRSQLPRNFLNSMIVSIATVSICVMACAMAAYCVVRVVRHRERMLSLFTLGLMIPIHTLLIPTFMILKTMNLLNNLWGLILVLIASNISLNIFIITNFMRDLPLELEEAATVDGASLYHIFFLIVLPMSKPSLFTVAVITFINSWNDFLFSYVILLKQTMQTITQGIMLLRSEYIVNYGSLCAGIMISIIPMIIIYALLQQQIIGGMTEGALKS